MRMSGIIYNNQCICLEEVTEVNRCILSCGHVFCADCTILYAMNNRKHEFNCPMCHREIAVSDRIANPLSITSKELSVQRRLRFEQKRQEQERGGMVVDQDLSIHRWMTVDEYCSLNLEKLENNEVCTGLGKLGKVKGLVCCNNNIVGYKNNEKRNPRCKQCLI